jgi:hypothetical protein
VEIINPDFNETTDLYLQLLRKAQELEDPKLVAMIIDRLKKNTQQLLCTDGGCQIIPFPGHQTVLIPPPLEERQFWPRLASVQMAIILGCYLALVTAHTILT